MVFLPKPDILRWLLLSLLTSAWLSLAETSEHDLTSRTPVQEQPERLDLDDEGFSTDRMVQNEVKSKILCKACEVSFAG